MNPTPYGPLPSRLTVKQAYALAVEPKFPPKGLLWHYTSGENLIKMIESRSIWATQLSCLNDKQELEFGIGLVKTALKIRADNSEGDEHFFYKRVIDWCDRTSNVESDAFVASFSAVEDDLSQWRAYGGSHGENGYCVGFDQNEVYNLSSFGEGGPVCAQLYQVAYCSEKGFSKEDSAPARLTRALAYTGERFAESQRACMCLRCSGDTA